MFQMTLVDCLAISVRLFSIPVIQPYQPDLLEHAFIIKVILK